MANLILELDPVTHLTAGALGTPGHRIFYVQAERGLERVTLLCEKEQVRALAEAIDELTANLEQEFHLTRGTPQVDVVQMMVKEPVDPLFRVGAMGLGYDAGRDRVLLVLQEALGDDEEGQRDPREVRLFASRAQMEMVSAYANSVVAAGRSPEQVTLQAQAHGRRNGHGE